jgi:hypothetical protein
MKFKEYLMQEEVTYSELNYAEDIIDALWNKLGVDVKFSRHFIDRVNDSRNGKPINVDEIIALFKKEYMEYGQVIKQLSNEDEAVMKDLFSKLNLPFAMNDKKDGDKELVAKTIMRKPTFHTSSKEFKVK